jgi:hypothetical protein
MEASISSVGARSANTSKPASRGGPAQYALPQGDLESAVALEQRDPADLAVLDVLGDEFEIEQIPVPRRAARQVVDRQLHVLDLAQADAHLPPLSARFPVSNAVACMGLDDARRDSQPAARRHKPVP